MSQGELFPFLAPETVLAYCRQFERRVLAIGPELSASQCQRLLGELAIAHKVLDRIEQDVTSSTAYRRRQLVAPELGVAELARLNRWPDLVLAGGLFRKRPAWRRRSESARAPRDGPGGPP